jgi:putative ABC transport system permease protein
MLVHLFKLIWNKKKQNSLLILEIFVSFMVMFAVFTLLVYYYRNYKLPMGFEYENVWVVNYTPPDIKSTDSVIMFNESIRNMTKTMKEIEDISFTSNNVPFSTNSSNTDVDYKKIHVFANVFVAEDSYADVLSIKMMEGRWFSKADVGLKERPIVINQTLKKELFGNATAVGQVIGTEMDKLKVVGVSPDLKHKGDYQAPENGMFKKLDTSEIRWHNSILIKVRPKAGAAFESKLYKSLSNIITNANIEIEHLSSKRVNYNNMTLVPTIIFIIVAAFLIINVALGLFGVLWYNINKRRGEIGLRRAVGATGKSISLQLIGEALVLSTISLILGLFFSLQFPLLNVFDLPAGIYIVAIGLAIIFIYLLVVACAIYPGKQAAAIYPAVALHEE